MNSTEIDDARVRGIPLPFSTKTRGAAKRSKARNAGTARTTKRRRRARRPVRRNDSPAPPSFQAALESGWTIKEQLSSWDFSRANKRDGFLFLKKASAAATLMVRFNSLYELGEPYFLEVDR